MTTLQLADNLYPTLRLQDTVEKALQLMNDFKTAYLPVISDEVFLGLLAESDIIDEEDKNVRLEVFQTNFIVAAINANNFFLKPATIYNLYQTNVIPVIDENNELMGTISSGALSNALSHFCDSSAYGALIV